MMNNKYIPPPIITSEAFDAGWSAGFLNEVYTNPYCEGNAEYLDYELGYSQGKNSELKRDPFHNTLLLINHNEKSNYNETINNSDDSIDPEFFNELDKFCDKYKVKLKKDYNSNDQLVLFTNVVYDYKSKAFSFLKE